MKRIASIVVAILLMTSCSNSELSKTKEFEASETLQKPSPVTSETSKIPTFDKKLTYRQTYTVNHEKNDSKFIVMISGDWYENFTLQVFDYEFNEVQHWDISEYSGIKPDFKDINLDGYKDIIIYVGGNLNEWCDLYTWDNLSCTYNKVTYEGFERISYFDIFDGYLENWVKDDYRSGVVQILVWEGNKLVLQSEENYETDS